jgi:hypothetical protein
MTEKGAVTKLFILLHFYKLDHWDKARKSVYKGIITLSRKLDEPYFSEMLKVAQTIIAIHEEINYMNALVGIKNDQTPPQFDLATMRWEPMPALVTARKNHACCAVKGTLVVLGGRKLGEEGSQTSSEVEMLSSGAFVDLPPLSCGGIFGAAAIAVEESDSAEGQVLLLGGRDGSGRLSTVHLVDLTA